jgi:hypothetical protein
MSFLRLPKIFWPSRCLLSSCQDFLDCQDVLVESVEIETLDRDHVKTDRNPQAYFRCSDNKQQYHVRKTSNTNLNASATTVRFMFIIKNYKNKFIQKCFFSKPNIFCIGLPVIEINCPSGLTYSNAKKKKKPFQSKCDLNRLDWGSEIWIKTFFIFVTKNLTFTFTTLQRLNDTCKPNSNETHANYSKPNAFIATKNFC